MQTPPLPELGEGIRGYNSYGTPFLVPDAVRLVGTLKNLPP